MSDYKHPVTPSEVTTDLQGLIDELVPGAKPTYVDVNPTSSGAQIRECFRVVEKNVQVHGGESVVGWALWELPTVFIEAEFHAVWRSPEGELVDITPRKRPTQRVLFLPDSSRRFEGRQVANVRRALKSDPQLASYLETFDLEFALMNRGERATQLGSITLRGAEAAEFNEINARRAALELRLDLSPLVGLYQPCPCGSGKKVKWCHRSYAPS